MQLPRVVLVQAVSLPWLDRWQHISPAPAAAGVTEPKARHPESVLANGTAAPACLLVLQASGEGVWVAA